VSGFDYLGLKAELLVEGVQATPEALREVGKRYKEQNHGLFGWDFEDHVGMVLPDDFILPDGTVVQFRKNSRSPYQVTKQKNTLVLSKNGERICRVSWIPRPDYYDRETVNHHKIVKLDKVEGLSLLLLPELLQPFSKRRSASFVILFQHRKPDSC
jgi:hypothetical protein